MFQARAPLGEGWGLIRQIASPVVISKVQVGLVTFLGGAGFLVSLGGLSWGQHASSCGLFLYQAAQSVTWPL